MTNTDDRGAPATAALTFEEELDDPASGANGLYDLDGRIIFVSPQYCALMQRSEAELLGRRWQDFTHLPDQLPFLEGYSGLVSGGPSYAATGRIVRPDGSLIWTSVRVGLLHGTLGARAVHFSVWPCPGSAGPALADDDLLDLDAIQCAAYVRQFASELSRLARARNLDVLSEVLSIAAAVAAGDVVTLPGLSADRPTLPTRQ